MTGGQPIARHRTALFRDQLSRPIRLALEEGLIKPSISVFDYGCGRGGDIERLRQLGIEATGWDPNHLPDAIRRPADVVNLGYVINVIEDQEERSATLRAAWDLARCILVVSAQLLDDRKDANCRRFGDGFLTQANTFQKYFLQSELRSWVDESLGVASVPAAPGVFYVFRDQAERQSFVAARFRQRVAVPRVRKSDLLYDRYRPAFDALVTFLSERGRLPHPDELFQSQELIQALGSLKKAFEVVRRVIGEDQWEEIRGLRSQDLLVYLALAKLEGRPRYSALSKDLQLDVKAFFGKYNQACGLADFLLYSLSDRSTKDKACRSSRVGKLTPNALYVHRTAIAQLPPSLRVYEGCGRALVGNVEEANVIKLSRIAPKISYLSYPEFDTDPHPSLKSSLRVDLQSFDVKIRHFSGNCPILHRKEEFVANDYPRRDLFARLTRQEEKYGLFDSPDTIGLQDAWLRLMKAKGLRLRGHRLMRIGDLISGHD